MRTQACPESFGALKLLSTLFSSVSGIPGGLSRRLCSAVGAGLGANFSTPFSNCSARRLALLGMVAYLTGVVRTPITSFLIVSEMTQDHAMIIPLMAAALIADGSSKLMPHSVYRALSEGF